MKIFKFLTVAIIWGVIGLAACAPPTTPMPSNSSVITEAPPTYTPYETTLVALGYPPPAPDRLTQDVLAKTRIAEAYPMWLYTATPGPTLSPATVGPTWTPLPTYPPAPTLVPTIAASNLFSSLSVIYRELAITSFEHPLVRITGWPNGFLANCPFCEARPYEWLDDNHLLLLPVTGQSEGMGISDAIFPVVMPLNGEELWFPISPETFYSSYVPRWSVLLQALIVRGNESLNFYKANGQIVNTIQGTGPFQLSPSGKRLLVNNVWLDLETGEMVVLEHIISTNKQSPADYHALAWTANERRFAACCFGVGDVDSGTFRDFQLDLETLGRGGPVDWNVFWVRDEAQLLSVFPLFGFATKESTSRQRVVPLVDPNSQTYENLCLLTQLQECTLQGVAPNNVYALVYSFDHLLNNPRQAIVDLNTFNAHNLPEAYIGTNWSPDSRFILIAESSAPMTSTGRYALFSVNGEFIPIADEKIVAPTWAPSEAQLAFLRANGRALITVDLGKNTVAQVDLPQIFTTAQWNRVGTQLALQAEDGSLWWVENPAKNVIKQLTPSLPNVRSISWSPSSSHLAFVSGPDIYVVQVAQP